MSRSDRLIWCGLWCCLCCYLGVLAALLYKGVH
jgi:hypothetical protein